jgi:predicted nuclease of predicted toxin-antitoxin system
VPQRKAPLRYLLDEDVNPAAAGVARDLGLDVVSVHDVGRRGLSDSEQLRCGAEDGRILVTRNRNDFILLTLETFRTGDPHHGVLILPHTVPNNSPSRIARTLQRWHKRQEPLGHPGPYIIDFLG